jgi:hypothetical protein
VSDIQLVVLSIFSVSDILSDTQVPISDEFGSPEDPDVSADPPRIWVKGETYPGCSYTRSLGDAAAKKSGVLARPEVSHCSILSMCSISANKE